MSALSGSRRETAAGSVSRCPDFLRERCAACPRAYIRTKENEVAQFDVIVACAGISIGQPGPRRPCESQNGLHHNIVIPASE